MSEGERVAACSSCGESLQEGARFCAHCGARVAAAPVAVEQVRASANRRGRWRLVVLGAVAVVALAALVLGDWAVRNAELERVLDVVAAGQAGPARYEEELDRVVADAMAEANAGGWVTDEMEQRLTGTIVELATDAQTRVVVARADAAAVGVLPWHGEIAQTRQAYVEHLDAWRAHLESVRTEPLTAGQDDPDVDATREVFQGALRDAVPPFPWPEVARDADIYDG